MSFCNCNKCSPVNLKICYNLNVDIEEKMCYDLTVNNEEKMCYNLNVDNEEKITKSFNNMNLTKELVRYINAYGFEKKSAIQQRAVLPEIECHDDIA